MEAYNHVMLPTDDALGLRLLGQVQELRAALDRLNDRPEARALKARLLTLHDASRGITVAPDVGKIVDEFFTTAREVIVKSFGTAAWDEPETVEEAKARMGRLPAAPSHHHVLADEVLDELTRTEASSPDGAGSYDVYEVRCLVAEVRRLRLQQTPGNEAPPTEADLERVLDLALGDMEMVEGDRCVGDKEHAKAQADQADVERVIRGAIKELRRLCSDQWLQRAVEEIGGLEVHEGYVDPAKALAILQKHRDGEA